MINNLDFFKEGMLVKNSGFTLIELVLVIVILGILSASAAPKFMNLATDVRIASFMVLKQQ